MNRSTSAERHRSIHADGTPSLQAPRTTSDHSTSPPHAKVRAAHLYEHGWIRPDDDPARARVQQPWHCAYVEAVRLRVGLARVVDPRDLIQDDLLRCVERGAVALI